MNHKVMGEKKGGGREFHLSYYGVHLPQLGVLELVPSNYFTK